MMRSPCRTCEYISEQRAGHRVYEQCSNEEAGKKFKYDPFWYDHSCGGHVLREECSRCNYNKFGYCECVYSKCEQDPTRVITEKKNID